MDSIDHQLLSQPAFSTMDICRACGISIQKLRYWENVCPLLKPRGKRRGRPVYDFSALQTAHEIRKLREQGLKMAAIRKRLLDDTFAEGCVDTELVLRLKLSEARRELSEVLRDLRT